MSHIAFGRAICDNLHAGERREWLVTNGLGGYAMGTIAGTLTRRYHGLLVAALRPPVERTLLVTKIDETVRYRDTSYDVFTNRWKGDFISPAGYDNIERFALDGTTPVWHFALADALLEKRVWLEHGENTAYVRYRVLRASASLDLTLSVFGNYRDHHGSTHAGSWRFAIDRDGNGIRVCAYDGATPYWISAAKGDWTLENVWSRDFVLSAETARGLDDRDDNLRLADLAVTLKSGDEVTVVASTHSGAVADDALERRQAHDAEVLAAWDRTPHAQTAPSWIRNCALAADRFVVTRPLDGDPSALSVIAGYPWFADWGRDTAISLPGLSLTTGRPHIAKKILSTFARFIDGGMLPNCFPESGTSPQYNTVDAALWYVEAVARYVTATNDEETLRALFPALELIVAGYRDGTRYGIHMDTDGSIVASAPDVQLTWMDAKIGDRVITPRRGKPVEIAALWYNALMRVAELASKAERDGSEYASLAATTRAGFERFWNDELACCYDVIDGPGGNDATLRPNQLFAIALPHPVLRADRYRTVVDVCAEQLVTSSGVRTLGPKDPRFTPRYGGSAEARDTAYHQGTAWPWLIGAFAVAHARAYGDAEVARSFLIPLADRLWDYGLGSISEIADGGAPFRPRGAIAQAWSVGELLRAWFDIGDICKV
ncbi:MAG TPA: amylo-alpha-1,6-glucosidase [Candidatus Baltobacteraceae bacterium]|nr:amylo-alpha-1,6-glucosidase [Candidatus Baltobacteraceae bacterium]